MPTYTCTVFDGNDQIVKVEAFDRQNDHAARQTARALAIRVAGRRRYELWCGNDKIRTELADPAITN